MLALATSPKQETAPVGKAGADIWANPGVCLTQLRYYLRPSKGGVVAVRLDIIIASSTKLERHFASPVVLSIQPPCSVKTGERGPGLVLL